MFIHSDIPTISQTWGKLIYLQFGYTSIHCSYCYILALFHHEIWQNEMTIFTKWWVMTIHKAPKVISAYRPTCTLLWWWYYCWPLTQQATKVGFIATSETWQQMPYIWYFVTTIMSEYNDSYVMCWKINIHSHWFSVQK